MALTEYNSYRIVPGRWSPYNSDDLRDMQIADAQIEAEYAARGYESDVPAPVMAPDEIERRRKKREYNKRYAAANRDKIKAQKREYNKRYDATHPRCRSEYGRAYREAHRDEILATQRARRAKKRAELEGGTPA